MVTELWFVAVVGIEVAGEEGSDDTMIKFKK